MLELRAQFSKGPGFDSQHPLRVQNNLKFQFQGI